MIRLEAFGRADCDIIGLIRKPQVLDPLVSPQSLDVH